MLTVKVVSILNSSSTSVAIPVLPPLPASFVVGGININISSYKICTDTGQIHAMATTSYQLDRL